MLYFITMALLLSLRLNLGIEDQMLKINNETQKVILIVIILYNIPNKFNLIFLM